jgi:hypothetical protein
VAARSKACLCGAARFLGLQVRIPPVAWMSVCCVVCCQSLGRLITRPEESCRLWCIVCDLETSWMRRRPWPGGGFCARNKQTNEQYPAYKNVVSRDAEASTQPPRYIISRQSLSMTIRSTSWRCTNGHSELCNSLAHRTIPTVAVKIGYQGQSGLLTSYDNLNDKLVRSLLFLDVTQRTLVVAGRLGTTCGFHLQSVFGYGRLGTTCGFHLQSIFGYGRLGTTCRSHLQSIFGYRRLGTTCGFHLQGTDRLSRNVGNWPPIYAAWRPRKATISFPRTIHQCQETLLKFVGLQIIFCLLERDNQKM